MGVLSTMTVSRRAAVQALDLLIDRATDEELGDALGALLSKRTLHNFRVVPGDQEDDPELDGLARAR